MKGTMGSVSAYSQDVIMPFGFPEASRPTCWVHLLQMHHIPVGHKGILGAGQRSGEWDGNRLRWQQLKQQKLSEEMELQQLDAMKNEVHKQMKRLMGSASVYSQPG